MYIFYLIRTIVFILSINSNYEVFEYYNWQLDIMKRLSRTDNFQ